MFEYQKVGVVRAALSLVFAWMATASLGCGGDDDVAGPPPIVESIVDENGDGLVVIGEHLTLMGFSGPGVRVTVDGIEAPRVESGAGENAVVRVPAGVAAGEVSLIAENAFGVGDPVSITVTRLAYTADFDDLAMTVLSVDGTNVEVMGRIAVDVAPGPFSVRFTPDGRTAVVACGVGFLPQSIIAALAPGAAPGGSVAIVDVIAGETVAVIEVGADSIPTGVAIHPDGQTAYVTNYAASVVSVIDLAERRLVVNLAVPRQPEEMALRSDGAFLLVNSVGGSVSVIDTATLEIVSTLVTGENDPSGVAWSANGTLGYVVHSFTDPNLTEDGTFAVLDLETPMSPSVVSILADGIGPTPFDVDLVPNQSLAIVTNLNVIFEPISIGPGSVSIVDLSSSPMDVETIAVGTAPIRAAVSSDGAVALVGNGLEQTVSVVDIASRTVVATVALNSTIGPSDIAIQP